MKHYSMEKLRKLAKRPEGFSEEQMEEYLAEAWWEQQLLDKEIIQLKEENEKLKKENKALEYRVKKFKAMNWKRMDDLVKALSPWKKNHQDHKRILEAIGELKDESKSAR